MSHDAENPARSGHARQTPARLFKAVFVSSLLALSFVLAACGGGGGTAGASTAQPTATSAPATSPVASPTSGIITSPVASPSASPEASPSASPEASPSGSPAASAASITVTSPTAGEKITSTDIPVHVETTGIDTACKYMGTPDKAGQGNIHAFLDHAGLGTLVGFYCGTDNFTISGQGITPGKHTIIIDLASNTHQDMLDTAQKIDIDYQPTTPSPLPEAKPAGSPTIKIVSPANNATVDPQFTLQVESTDFTPSCDLEGKPLVTGYGHYHVMVDMGKGASPLAGLVLMPCTSSIPLDLSAWPAGEHTLTVALAQNDHSPVPNTQPATITINLSSSSGHVAPTTGHHTSPTGEVSTTVHAILTRLGIG